MENYNHQNLEFHQKFKQVIQEENKILENLS